MQIIMEQDEQIQTKLKTILALSLQSVEVLEINWQLYRQGVRSEKEMDKSFKDMMKTVQEVKQALKLEQLYEEQEDKEINKQIVNKNSLENLEANTQDIAISEVQKIGYIMKMSLKRRNIENEREQ